MRTLLLAVCLTLTACGANHNAAGARPTTAITIPDGWLKENMPHTARALAIAKRDIAQAWADLVGE